MKHQIEELIQALQDDNWRVRQSSVWALDKIGPDDTKQAVLHLILALQQDDNQDVRRCAVRALGDIGSDATKQALPALIQALQDDDEDIRQSAVRAVSKNGHVAT